MPLKRKRYRTVEDSSDESDVDVDIQEISDSNSDARRSPFPAKSPSIRHRKKQEIPDAISQEGQARSNRSCPTSQSKCSDKCGLCFEEKSEVELIKCTNCEAVYHSMCLNLPKKMPPWFKRSCWRCNDCKICEACNQHRKEIEVVTCGKCERSFHLLCLNLKLDRAPSNGWVCPKCAPIVQEGRTLTSPNGQVTVKRKRGRPRMFKPPGTSESSQTDGEFEKSMDVKEVSLPSTSMGHKIRRRDAFSPFAKRVKIKKCPIPGCDGQGHITGKFEMHHTVSGCPNYQKITPEKFKLKGKVKERRKEAVPLQPLGTQPKDHPKKALRSKVQLSLMPEKIRAAVTSKEITPEEHNTRHVTQRKSQLSDDGCFVSPSLNELEASSIVTEELDLLQVVAPGKDFRMFKEAWTKALEANEEEVVPMNERPGCRCIEFGSFEIDTWYSSPYPEEFQRLKRLYICEFCLKYMKSQTILRRHLAKCNHRYPPGDEIYRKNNLSIFEVDGKNHKVYCQNLCLLAKLFLDHKTLYYDVEPFLFYVMTKADSTGCHMIGYFSKEKKSFLNYNVSCILTLPIYMKQGYGKMLIDFSYLLSKVEEKVGSPEKPLSDLGLISYRSYWKSILIKYLKTFYYDQVSVKDISQETAIHPSDVVSTLQYLGILKYWKGKHVILRATELFDDYDKKVSSRPSGYQEIDPHALSWKPPVVQDRT